MTISGHSRRLEQFDFCFTVLFSIFAAPVKLLLVYHRSGMHVAEFFAARQGEGENPRGRGDGRDGRGPKSV